MKLKRDAERGLLGEDIANAVTSAPATSCDAQRQAWARRPDPPAGVLRIVNGRPAADYGLDKEAKGAANPCCSTGGSTFDVSLLEIGEGVVEVRATSGDNHTRRRRLGPAGRRLAGGQVQGLAASI